MGWLGDLIGGGASGIIDSITDGVDKFVTTDEEKQELELLKKKAAFEIKKLEFDAEGRFFEDRANARKMQSETNSKIPGMLTMIFTVGYFGLTTFMLAFLLGKLDTELSQFVTVFISTIFGAFNAIMVQIISFYFGSSKGGEDTGAAIASSFKNATKEDN